MPSDKDSTFPVIFDWEFFSFIEDWNEKTPAMGYMHDHVEPLKFLCLNCGGGGEGEGGRVEHCCDGFLGKVPLCCSKDMYQIQAATNILAG